MKNVSKKSRDNHKSDTVVQTNEKYASKEKQLLKNHIYLQFCEKYIRRK